MSRPQKDDSQIKLIDSAVVETTGMVLILELNIVIGVEAFEEKYLV